LRASGFKLHYAVCAFFDFERQGITELQGDNERINDQARAFNAVKELAFVMTDLNTGKETSDTQNAQISTEEFRARYAPEVKQRLDEQQVQAPEFLVSQPFIAGLAQQRDAEVKAQKHKDFLASAPDNSLLIRFDMTGLRLLNKALSSVAVEAILGDIHSQVVAHAFRVASSTHGIGFLSHELRSGVIDVLVDPDEWRKYKSDVLDYADHCLGDLYKFHLDDEEIGLVALRAVNGDHSVQRDKSDSPQDSSSANKAENLLSQLEKQFRIVETPLDQGDLYASLSRVERLMGDLKARKDDVRHISPRHNAAKHIS
jgi:hypothetical protein